MLRIVHPPSGGKEPVHPKKGARSPALRLTDVEAMRLRAALRNLRSLYGSWPCLAEVMGVKPKSLGRFVAGRSRGSHSLAFRAAQAAGVTVETVLGGLKATATCPHCGATWEVRS